MSMTTTKLINTRGKGTLVVYIFDDNTISLDFTLWSKTNKFLGGASLTYRDSLEVYTLIIPVRGKTMAVVVNRYEVDKWLSYMGYPQAQIAHYGQPVV